MTSSDFIDGLFSSVASHYDLMNDLMSLGAHRVWRRLFVKELPWADLPSSFTYLDMSCGTGDMGGMVLDQADAYQKNIHAFFCDPNRDMLEKAQKKWTNPSIEWVQTYAETTPFQDESIDLYTVAFGLRNTQDRSASLQEVYRILKPGGFFFCLEFSMPAHPILKSVYKPYLRFGLPVLGRWIAHNAAAYRYLGDSICSFPSPYILEAEMAQVGLNSIGHRLLMEGIVAIHWGEK